MAESSTMWVENTEGKGEIARYEQFLLFPTVFSKDLHCRHVKTKAYCGKCKTNKFQSIKCHWIGLRG